MTIAWVGASLGRSGTSSFRDALNQLGFPCYHMTELFKRQPRKNDAGFWMDAAETPPAPDAWAKFLVDYKSIVDFPCCPLWSQIAKAFPEAKIVLSVHPGGPEAWYESTRTTIFDWYERVLARKGGPDAANFPDSEWEIERMLTKLVYGEEGLLKGVFQDRDATLKIYETHNQSVRDAVPAGRLVEWSADRGWRPICDALGVDAPDEPFPKSNDRQDLSRRIELLERIATMKSRREP